MEDAYLYRRIAERVRQEILEGRIQAGERLPSVRKLMIEWNCTPGTVQRAYHELAEQGLVVSRPGKGTLVSGSDDDLRTQRPLRKATLVNRAEAFLLEVLSSGYDLGEIQRAFDIAAERWRSQKEQPEAELGVSLRLGGSHDLILGWVVAHMAEVLPGCAFGLQFSGSLGGLMGLAEGRLDLAGCHLWDRETRTYNDPFVHRLLPGRRVGLIHLAVRRIGLLVPPQNPLGIGGLADLVRGEVRFANRKPGSGTRVWLDASLAELGIEGVQVGGYSEEYLTHSEVARSIAEGRANVGLGLEAAARGLGLDFIALTTEPYELVGLESGLENPTAQKLIAWLSSPQGKLAMSQFEGYDCSQSGSVRWV